MLALALAAHGLRRRSLSTSGACTYVDEQSVRQRQHTHANAGRRRPLTLSAGAVAAAVVGFVHMVCGARFGGSLIVFYLTGSRVRTAPVLHSMALERAQAVQCATWSMFSKAEACFLVAAHEVRSGAQGAAGGRLQGGRTAHRHPGVATGVALWLDMTLPKAEASRFAWNTRLAQICLASTAHPVLACLRLSELRDLPRVAGHSS